MDYTYDEAHSLKTVTDCLNKQTVYTYNNAGDVTKAEYPNGTWSDHTVKS